MPRSDKQSEGRFKAIYVWLLMKRLTGEMGGIKKKTSRIDASLNEQHKPLDSFTGPSRDNVNTLRFIFQSA